MNHEQDLQNIKAQIDDMQAAFSEALNAARLYSDDFGEYAFEDGLFMAIDEVDPFTDEMHNIMASIDDMLADLYTPTLPTEGQLPLLPDAPPIPVATDETDAIATLRQVERFIQCAVTQRGSRSIMEWLKLLTLVQATLTANGVDMNAHDKETSCD